MALLVHGYHGGDDTDKLRGQAENNYYTSFIMINAYNIMWQIHVHIHVHVHYTNKCTKKVHVLCTLYCILTKGSSLGCLVFKEEIYVCAKG